MLVNLVYLATPNTGGWVSFTAHLAHGLNHAGHLPMILRQGRRTERTMRPYGMGFQYANTSGPMLEHLAGAQPMIVTACEPKAAPLLAPLVRAGAAVVVHDPTELKGDLPAVLDEAKPGRVFVIRRSMLKHLPQATVIPHPYQRASGQARDTRCHAVAFSRLDWDKHTSMIVEANQLLPAGRRVLIHGAENRLYTHHKLTSTDPGWRNEYRGPMPRGDLWAGVRLAATASWTVDLSAIKGDGGGTQYTFLEALDAGSRLIINRRWLTGDPDLDEMLGYATPVSDAADLIAELVRPSPLPPAPNAGLLLARHSAHTVANKIMEAWESWA